MSEHDYDEPEDDLAVEERQFKARLGEMAERASLLEAVHVASGIKAEILGEIPGLIKIYLREMQQQAVVAVAELLRKPLMTEAERISAQLQIQPYAHVYKWLEERVATGHQSSRELAHLIEGDNTEN